MKLQTKYASSDYFADIIQINSKSGLRGSKANFAYAGGSSEELDLRSPLHWNWLPSG